MALQKLTPEQHRRGNIGLLRKWDVVFLTAVAGQKTEQILYHIALVCFQVHLYGVA